MKELHNYILEQKEILIESKSDELAQMLREGKEIDEGFLGALIGGLAGISAGAAIMKAVCKAIGVEKGLLYNLLTSKVICGVAGAAIGDSVGK